MTSCVRHRIAFGGFVAILIGVLVALAAGRGESQQAATKEKGASEVSNPATGHEGHHGAAGATAAKPSKPNRGGVYKTITGEVMDPACFLEAGPKSIGQGHYQCAIDCVRSGQTLAIYDRDADRIYFVAGELPGKNPNEPLLPYIHKKVDVTGTVYNRSQAWGIVIVKVAPHQPGNAAPAAAPKGGTR